MSLQGRSQQIRLTPRSLGVRGDIPLTQSKTAVRSCVKIIRHIMWAVETTAVHQNMLIFSFMSGSINGKLTSLKYYCHA